jgi:two-component system, NarL family, sensor histidine kinase DegS
MDNNMTSLENESTDLLELIEDELEQAQKNLNEVNLMLEQSQVELSKLTQRNATITGHLQKIQIDFESIPKADIRMAYNAVLDTQQRLLVMKGQLDKLQAEKKHINHAVDYLQNVRNILINTSNFSGGSGSTAVSNVLEMVIDAQESERQRLSRQMHDGPAQALSNFIVQAEITNKLFDLDQVRAKEELANLKTSAAGTFQKIRNFIIELRPMMLDDLGFFPTVRRYIESFKEQTNINLSIAVYGEERRLDPYLEVMLFRAIQELIRNAYQHNQENVGNLQVEVEITIDDENIRASVTDNGSGFNPEILSQTHGLGLKLIRERVDMLGGIFRVEISDKQECSVIIQVPSLEAGILV